MHSVCSSSGSDCTLADSPINLTRSEEDFLAGSSLALASPMLHRAQVATRPATPPVLLAVIQPLQLRQKPSKQRVPGVASEPSSTRTSLDSIATATSERANTQTNPRPNSVSDGRTSPKGKASTRPPSPQRKAEKAVPPPRLITVRKQPMPLPKPPTMQHAPATIPFLPQSAPAPKRSFDYIRPLPPIPVPPSAPAHIGRIPRRSSANDVTPSSAFDSPDVIPMPPSPSLSIPSSTSTSASVPPTPPLPTSQTPPDIRIDNFEPLLQPLRKFASYDRFPKLTVDVVAGRSATSSPLALTAAMATAKEDTSRTKNDINPNLLAAPEADEATSTISPLPPDIPVAPSPATAKKNQLNKLTKFLGARITDEVIYGVHGEHDVPDGMTREERRELVALKNGREQILKALIAPNRYEENDSEYEYGYGYGYGREDDEGLVSESWFGSRWDGDNRLSMHWVCEKGGSRWVEDDYDQVLKKLRTL
ncbi:hypothetical protein AX16_004828 [Volvariella volvacea WC 439]|nr:hypothetical protein AX16_004828 [Volvariella volvacea WC 439]